MKTSTEIRLENAKALIEASEGGQSDAASLLGISPQQLQQIVGPTPTRNIGPAMARRFEQAFIWKGAGWTLSTIGFFQVLCVTCSFRKRCASSII